MAMETGKGHTESSIFTVSEITLHIKQLIETQIQAVNINGEISNFTHHSSGHMYFNLKDEKAVLRCAFFRNQNYTLDFKPRDGDQVVCYGKLSVFEKSGQYQLIVQSMIPYGKGILQQRFELLKAKLMAEGLFDNQHKVPIPKFPETIGIITSPTGAALQDILNIIKRRYPCRILVYPTLVQGDEAPEQIIKGLKFFNQRNNVDVIIITRGGGSQEDLFCYNDEYLAREIFASKLPVISAVGHEIDFTIADFVADLRAPTPSAAAELVVHDRKELLDRLDYHHKKIKLTVEGKLHKLMKQLQDAKIALVRHSPERELHKYQQRFDIAVIGLKEISRILQKKRQELDSAFSLLRKDIAYQLQRLMNNKSRQFELISWKLHYEILRTFQMQKHRMEMLSINLSELSPQNNLKRGYAIAVKGKELVKSVTKVKKEERIELILRDGKLGTKIESID